MHEEDLPAQLRKGATGPRIRSASCPDEHQLAAYVDGTLDEAGIEPLESHLADCDACLGLVGLLSREREAPAAEAVPELTLARVRSLPSKRRGWSRFAPHTAAAAVALITISALTDLLPLQRSGSDPSAVPGARATRSGSSTEPRLHVLYPAAGVALEADHLRFRWTVVEGSRYYEVRVVSDSGDLIREERVFGTEWRPMGQLELRPGVEYFVQVDAYPADDKTVSSEHVPFRVEPSR